MPASGSSRMARSHGAGADRGRPGPIRSAMAAAGAETAAWGKGNRGRGDGASGVRRGAGPRGDRAEIPVPGVPGGAARRRSHVAAERGWCGLVLPRRLPAAGVRQPSAARTR